MVRPVTGILPRQQKFQLQPKESELNLHIGPRKRKALRLAYSTVHVLPELNSLSKLGGFLAAAVSI